MMSNRGSPEPCSSQYSLARILNEGHGVSDWGKWQSSRRLRRRSWNAIVTHRCMLLTRLPLYIIRLTMPNQETLYHVADRVATITLNRPDKLNAWTAVMEREVRAAMGQAEHDENVRVIVLTGAGRGFCAGADMSLLSTVAEKGLDEVRRGGGEGTRRDFRKKY